jgi:hypothetical protein
MVRLTGSGRAFRRTGEIPDDVHGKLAGPGFGLVAGLTLGDLVAGGELLGPFGQFGAQFRFAMNETSSSGRGSSAVRIGSACVALGQKMNPRRTRQQRRIFERAVWQLTHDALLPFGGPYGTVAHVRVHEPPPAGRHRALP